MYDVKKIYLRFICPFQNISISAVINWKVNDIPPGVMQEEFEDTEGVIRIRKSKNRQHNGQKKRDKDTNNDLQNIHIKLKIE